MQDMKVEDVMEDPGGSTRVLRRRNPRGEGGRLSSEIIDGAIAIVTRTGSSEAVTLRSVAREVGIAAPSIYAHFPDRDAILAAVVLRVFDDLKDRIEEAMAPLADPVERLVAGCQAYVSFGLENPGRYQTLFRAAAPRDRLRAPARVSVRGPAAYRRRGVRVARGRDPPLRRRRRLVEHRCFRRCDGRLGGAPRDHQPEVDDVPGSLAERPGFRAPPCPLVGADPNRRQLLSRRKSPLWKLTSRLAHTGIRAVTCTACCSRYLTLAHTPVDRARRVAHHGAHDRLERHSGFARRAPRSTCLRRMPYASGCRRCR